jgi:hypothetical protein
VAAYHRSATSEINITATPISQNSTSPLQSTSRFLTWTPHIQYASVWMLLIFPKDYPSEVLSKVVSYAANDMNSKSNLLRPKTLRMGSCSVRTAVVKGYSTGFNWRSLFSLFPPITTHISNTSRSRNYKSSAQWLALRYENRLLIIFSDGDHYLIVIVVPSKQPASPPEVDPFVPYCT